MKSNKISLHELKSLVQEIIKEEVTKKTNKTLNENKISLNELKSLVQEIIKEETEQKTVEKVAEKIEDILKPEELEFLKNLYKTDKQFLTKELEKSIKKNSKVSEAMEIPEEGDEGMTKKEIKTRQIIDKIISYGGIGSTAAMFGGILAGIAPMAAIGILGSALGFLFKDAAWWKKDSHLYSAQKKYGVQ
jgi:hypothetical protein